MQTDESKLFSKKGLTSFFKSFQQPLLFFARKKGFIYGVSNSFNRVFNKRAIF